MGSGRASVCFKVLAEATEDLREGVAVEHHESARRDSRDSGRPRLVLQQSELAYVLSHCEHHLRE